MDAYDHPCAATGQQILDQLTTAEKIALLSGSDFWHTASIPRMNIPALRMSDGPNGVRGTKFFDSVPAACLPCGTGLGATWDKELVEEAGLLIARECHAKSAHIWLGPTVNIQRSPLGGRGFESFSEDPMLSGLIAASMIRSIQAMGVGSAIKHFVANDMEHMRTTVNCIISDRALHEIYLMPFQIAVRDANPWLFMTAYNRVNGTHASEHHGLLQEHLRDDWGYDGCIISDWYGTYSTVEAVEAGLDIEMPGPTAWRGNLLSSNVNVQKIMSSTIDRRVSSVLRLIERCMSSGIPERGPEMCLDHVQDRDLMERLATDSIVLLKNDRHLLPLRASMKTAIVGANSKQSFFCGGGSASLKPYRSVSIYEAVAANLDDTPLHAEGCQIYNMLPLLGDRVRSLSGRIGYFTMHLYSAPPWEVEQIAFDVLELNDTNIVLYDYSHPSIKDDVLYATIDADLVVEETNTYIFGVTVAGTARLYLDGKLVVDNFETQTRGESFFGSGSVEETGSVRLEASKVYRIRVEFGSAATSKLSKSGAPVFGAGGVRIGCASCTDENEDLNKALEVVAEADQVVLCVGLGPDWESEGSDRTHMMLPGNQNELISKICAINKNVVVVIQAGTPTSGPWDEVPAILQAWYGGNESGSGVANILFGGVSPSGKLPLSWPKAIEDNPAFLSHRSEAGRCYYSEDIFVGYRYYEKTKREVQWPFGHGLSYASFEFSDLRLVVRDSGQDTKMEVLFCVTNTSDSVGGNEVCQAYVRRSSTSVLARPIKELKGFTKAFIPAGESRELSILIPIKYAVSVWDETTGSWLAEKGRYSLLVGNSSIHTPLQADFDIETTYNWQGL